MGFWDVIAGRSKPKAPQLDSLFLVPSAAITLETTLGLRPTGAGSVCYRAASGNAFAQVQADVVELLNADPDEPDVGLSQDEFGFTWLVVHDDPDDAEGIGDLCTDLHAVNTSLEDHGFGPGLLCSLIPFVGADGRRVGLVYLYKQGTFYAFAPVPGAEKQRDNLLEIQLRDTLAGELPMEQDLGRWLAVWGAPGL
ncbi:hypothetical protein ASC77_03860 [Nocardioides sp. Root1257]|uniref:PspA-associated protein PspAB n=1 Tax=unclassified Nocardioides TaxID=2615069 RepID=UPI0006FFBAF8|nr:MULTISPECIES: hypothetical protein [unclassified Nocardioides]KQW53428.1 hypothetical protein ASC77_03860 [Nocardioides sp. Root1257]KRC56114.1 hypothetical protein ASE24_03860 [Nocardioides sp. Root224]